MLKESSDTLLHGKTHSCAAKGLENGKAYVVRARFKCLVGNIALAEYFVPTADSGSLQVAGRRSQVLSPPTQCSGSRPALNPVFQPEADSLYIA